MALGGGNYEKICTEARRKAGAIAAAFITWNPWAPKGKQCGFEVQGPPEFLAMVPDILEDVARTIRADMKKDITSALFEEPWPPKPETP